ncbi:type IV toxin-antitoxin system AbiEi family antitoxin [uncultured Polaribacter sp.]|uniref:type IV toxin-antitoxin system AbiEi family antitoxin domain-containing protein n=1 Tax=uncultured Polaribacter sp. TaxID=174711 RepID=UPI0026394381|nr:type IV toxin-antitoxin system AbiEi family antitoxin [uncultured Polaribacter sp.]
MDVSSYIKELQSVEEYSFSLEEVLKKCNKTEIAIKRELSRLVTKKEITNLRKGYYLIIPPRYSKQEQIPIQLFVEKLFKHLKSNYYLGFYSAAKFHGAGHQQVQRDYVMTDKAFSNIRKSSLDIHFFTTSKWPSKNIVEKKSDAGIFKISSPALTAVDLIHHHNKLGGINRMLAILEELSEEITKNDIEDLLSWYPHKSTLQRFGFLLEQELQVESELYMPIIKHLKASNFFPVLLSPKSKEKPGATSNNWKVDVNIQLENDL